MRYSLIALGAGNMAVAMFTNTTDSQAADTAAVNAMPATVGDYELVGCATSATKFVDFVNVATTEDMDVNFCGASCQTKFMAVDGKNCLCSDKSDGEKVDDQMCNNPGAAVAAAANERRDASVPMTSALSLYMRAKAADPAGVVTKTVTSTKVATITSCAPTVTDCPIGKPTHHVVTKVTEVCPRPTEVIEWHKKKIVCYGGHCAPEIPCEGQKQRVICDGPHCHSEWCTTEEWSKLVICKGDDCHWSKCEGDHCYNKKVVCYDGKCSWEKCYGDECHKKFVCKGDECKHEKCWGDDCHKKFICDPKGDNCKPAPPPCHGKDCPKPPPPCKGKDCPPPCKGPHCPPPPPCKGPHCPPPPPPCKGPNCPPPPPCHGENCKFVPCEGKDCYKPIRPTGSVYPKPMPTNPPIVAGAGNMVANVIGAAAGLLFVL